MENKPMTFEQLQRLRQEVDLYYRTQLEAQIEKQAIIEIYTILNGKHPDGKPFGSEANIIGVGTTDALTHKDIWDFWRKHFTIDSLLTQEPKEWDFLKDKYLNLGSIYIPKLSYLHNTMEMEYPLGLSSKF